MPRAEETTLNGQLGLLLDRAGLDARPEQRSLSGRPDVQVVFATYRVAIECKHPGKQNEAKVVEQTFSRLIPQADRIQADADVGVSVVYPEGLMLRDLNEHTVLKCAVLFPPNTRSVSKKWMLNQAQWQNMPVEELARMLPSLREDIGEPDAMARTLNLTLEAAVERLPDSARRDIAHALHLKKPREGWKAPSKRGLLVLASAAMFHARLDGYLGDMRPTTDDRTGEPFAGDWPPSKLQHCIHAPNTPEALRKAWELILALDYKPVFRTGLAVLVAPSWAEPKVVRAIRSVCHTALSIVSHVEGRRHDLLGRIFHAVLDDARYDGSFYTTSPAATLLAGLAIREDDVPADPAEMRVLDPACGTGTLLMAAAERIKDVLGSGASEANAKALIEHVLAGYDINITATHMAATTLGLMSPTTSFRNMNIHRAAFGRFEDRTGAPYYRAGSLEYFPKGRPILFAWPKSWQVETEEELDSPDPADLVIMNPPFTRKDLRHKQLPAATLNGVKARERELFYGTGIEFDSSGPAFILLGDYLLKDTGIMALIGPSSGLTNPSTQNVRALMGRRYHIETVIVSHDPERQYFSENTKISEVLTLARRKRTNEPDRPTLFVNLAVNPGTVHEARTLANNISECRWDRIRGTCVEWSVSEMKAGRWEGGQFFSPHLSSFWSRMRKDDRFVPIHKVADSGATGRGARYFDFSSVPSVGSVRSVYEHNSSARARAKGKQVVDSMRVETDGYITPKAGQERLARSAWSKRGRLLLPERLRLPLIRPNAVWAESPTIGSAWIVFVSRLEGRMAREHEKAICVWLNSTPGRVCRLAVRIFFSVPFVKWQVKNHQATLVPVMNDQQRQELAAAFDRLCDDELGVWSDARDRTHIAIDRTVCEVLGMSEEEVYSARLELSREPMVTGKRYEAYRAESDRYEGSAPRLPFAASPRRGYRPRVT